MKALFYKGFAQWQEKVLVLLQISNVRVIFLTGATGYPRCN
ncbi:hypothetical protein C4K37_5606 [Pseudomonas chlororaphis subsp. piscium]|nr:hypothetical protein C4K37_5606 [Pseudomonas chlororaphis subsp. piscium]AZC46524.1 hypothetical protein C4K36_5625 [Pseudomonas chlororaphis subsp. piscium]AZC53214.1 hypothetical protein C4K35_5657 [Pseudomonas chlororaphis subsp. piscium]AZC78172.1 hypothetical protein C4K31_5295 [Pseudomonas chlororaphis subsp. piscium]AZC91794.1 hypothetical protein C4K29_5519 [Pseudomonas chlororaphis subsp. piscium]